MGLTLLLLALLTLMGAKMADLHVRPRNALDNSVRYNLVEYKRVPLIT